MLIIRAIGRNCIDTQLNVSQSQRLHACSFLHAKLEVMCRMCLWAVHHCKSVAHMLGAFEQVFPHGLFLENQVFGNQLNLPMQMQTNTTTSANRVSPIWTRFSLSISDFNINISDHPATHLGLVPIWTKPILTIHNQGEQICKRIPSRPNMEKIQIERKKTSKQEPSPKYVDNTRSWFPYKECDMLTDSNPNIITSLCHKSKLLLPYVFKLFCHLSGSKTRWMEAS